MAAQEKDASTAQNADPSLAPWASEPGSITPEMAGCVLQVDGLVSGYPVTISLPVTVTKL